MAFLRLTFENKGQLSCHDKTQLQGEPHGAQKAGEEAGPPLALVRQLVGNNDEVTDIRFVGPLEAPTHLAVTTNSPAIRLFDTDALGAPHLRHHTARHAGYVTSAAFTLSFREYITDAHPEGPGH